MTIQQAIKKAIEGGFVHGGINDERSIESFFNQLIPENDPVYTHVDEGSDDMPAHIKSSVFGVSLSIPISNAMLNLGIWQGICLCEFRRNGGPRTLVITVLS